MTQVIPFACIHSFLPSSFLHLIVLQALSEMVTWRSRAHSNCGSCGLAQWKWRSNQLCVQLLRRPCPFIYSVAVPDKCCPLHPSSPPLALAVSRPPPRRRPLLACLPLPPSLALVAGPPLPCPALLSFILYLPFSSQQRPQPCSHSRRLIPNSDFRSFSSLG